MLKIIRIKREMISIHAPSRERLVITGEWKDVEDISIHAPSRERRQGDKIIILHKYFNPRSLAGATQKRLYHDLRYLFQSTLPRGSDLQIKAFSDNVTLISIHAPSRERLFTIFCIPTTITFQSTLPRGSDPIWQ